MIRRTLISLALLAAAAYPQAGPSGPDANLLRTLLDRHKPVGQRFEFGAIGDQHYGAAGIAKWPALQASINRATSLQFKVDPFVQTIFRFE